MRDEAVKAIGARSCARCGFVVDERCRECFADPPWVSAVGTLSTIPYEAAVGISAPAVGVVGVIAFVWDPLWYAFAPLTLALAALVGVYIYNRGARQVLIGTVQHDAFAIVHVLHRSTTVRGERGLVGQPFDLAPALADTLRPITMEQALHVGRQVEARAKAENADVATARAAERAFIAFALGGMVARGHVRFVDVTTERWTRDRVEKTFDVSLGRRFSGALVGPADRKSVHHPFEREILNRLFDATVNEPEPLLDPPGDHLPPLRLPLRATSLFEKARRPGDDVVPGWDRTILTRFPPGDDQAAFAAADEVFARMRKDPEFTAWTRFLFEGDAPMKNPATSAGAQSLSASSG